MPVYYSVKPEQKIVKAILVVKEQFGYQTFEGIAKCCPEDTFNEIYGKRLARAKALLKFKKAELQSHKNDKEIFAYAYREYIRHQQRILRIHKTIYELESEISKMK